MPISTNAPFNEFGQSQILRDIEQLYLALNGAGSGGPGDGQTQDQTTATSQDSGGLPDLSGLATIAYVDALIASLYPISVAQGGTGATSSVNAMQNIGGISYRSVVYTTDGTFTVPAGVYRVRIIFIGGGGGPGGCGGVTLTDSGGDTVYLALGGGAGGSSALGILDVNVAPGESVSYTIGSGGSVGGAGGDGTATTVSMSGGASSFSFSSNGGGGGRDAGSPNSVNLGGGGGYVVMNSGDITNRYGVLVANNGTPGATGCVQPNTIGAIGHGGAAFSNGSSVTYGGYGGISATASAVAGSNGFVAFVY